MTTKISITNFVRQHKSITVATLALAVIIAVIFGVLPLFNSTTGYVNVNALPASDTFVYVTPYGNEIGFVGGVGAGTGAGSGLPITQPATISVKDLTTGQILSYTVQPIAYQLQWYMFDFTTMTVTLSNTDYFPTPEPTDPPTQSPTAAPTPVRYYIAYSAETTGAFSSIRVTDILGNQVFSGTYGESLTITATPATGQTFKQWNILNTDGSIKSIVTQNPYTFTLTDSITFVALNQTDTSFTPAPTWNIQTSTPAPTSEPSTNVSLTTILTAVVAIAIVAVVIVFVLIAKKKKLPI